MLIGRQQKIVNIMYKKNDWMTGAEIADVLKVSSRTIRKDIIDIRESLSSNAILSSKSKGYKLNSKFDFSSFLCKEKGLDAVERIIYLVKELVVNNEGFDLYDMSKMMYVSDATINSDIVTLRKLMKSIGLIEVDIHIDNDHIMLVDQSPNRDFILGQIIENSKESYEIEELSFLFPLIDIKYLLEEIVEKNLIKFDYSSRYISIENLVINILVIIERARLGLIKNISYPIEISSSVEYKLADAIINKAMVDFKIKVHPNEVSSLARYLSNIRLLEEKELSIREEDIKQDRIYAIIIDVLKDVLMQYNVDFSADEETISDLSKHIKMAQERLSLGVKVFNPIREEMKIRYPFLYDVALFMTKKLEENNFILNQEETSFIVAYLGVALEKVKVSNYEKDKVNIIVIALEGKITLKYILDKMNLLVNNQEVNIRGVSSLYEVLNLNSLPSEIYTYVTTSRIINLKNSPDLLIHPTFNNLDAANFESLIAEKIEKLSEYKFEEIFNYFFKKDLFIKDLNVNSSDEAIRSLCDCLKNGGYIDDQFTELVFERESLFPTSLPTKIAVPHSTKAIAFKSGIAIGINNKPIKWSGKNVRIVFLLAIAPFDINRQSTIHEFIANIICDEKKVQLLLKVDSFDDFESRLRAFK